VLLFAVFARSGGGERPASLLLASFLPELGSLLLCRGARFLVWCWPYPFCIRIIFPESWPGIISFFRVIWIVLPNGAGFPRCLP
jgi:hypothetical protein